ncbi:PAS domain S-box protein [bacterium]|nr:MAG: PAS domain S-box protein [bacterium]
MEVFRSDPENPLVAMGAPGFDIDSLWLSEERNRALAHATLSVVWTTTPDGYAQYFDRWHEATGQTREETIGYGWLNVVHPEDREGALEAWNYSVASKTIYTHEYRVLMRDGSYRWYQARGVPVVGGDGNIREWVGLCEDIHAQVEAERERDRFFTIGVDMMLVAGFDGFLKRINSRWTEVLGWSEDELMSRPMISFVHPSDQQRTILEIARGREGEETLDVQDRWQAKDGSYRWLSWRLRPYPDEGLVYGAATDVTEQKETEEALRRIEDHLSFIIGTNPQMPWIADRNGRLMNLSDRWKSVFGMDGKPAPHKWLALVHPEDRPLLQKAWIRALENGTPYDVEHRTWTLEDKYVWMRSRATPRKDPDGQISQWYGSTEDISSQKNVEEELERLVQERTAALIAANEALTEARDAALSASRAKTEFLRNVSHEIRTPLNGVIGTLALLEDETLYPRARKLVKTIASSSETLMSVLNDVLDYSRMEAGQVRIEPVITDVGDLAADVVALYQERAAAKGIELRLCPPPKPLRAMADSASLRQVLSNLVSNGIKFTEKGTVELEWKWQSEGSDECRVTFVVRDTGIGIPFSRLEAIFESFTQADGSMNRSYGGTGLGLTISGRLVHLMGGWIKVQSKVGHGAAFTVDLVLKRVFEPPKELKDDEIEGRESPDLRVLLAEDNSVNVLVATALLQRCGCRVEVAANGLEAIRKFETSYFDLVFMDIQMPVADGLEATRAIRDRESHESRQKTPIYALTANLTLEDRQACQRAGMDGMIPKPIRMAALHDVIVAIRNQKSVSLI